MPTELKPDDADQTVCGGRETADRRRELALLAEFMRSRSVAALAGEIAERLNAREDELIAAAGLAPAASAKARE